MNRGVSAGFSVDSHCSLSACDGTVCLLEEDAAQLDEVLHALPEDRQWLHPHFTDSEQRQCSIDRRTASGSRHLEARQRGQPIHKSAAQQGNESRGR